MINFVRIAITTVLSVSLMQLYYTNNESLLLTVHAAGTASVPLSPVGASRGLHDLSALIAHRRLSGRCSLAAQLALPPPLSATSASRGGRENYPLQPFFFKSFEVNG